MELGPFVQWAAFAVFAFIAVAGALGMATTMSMFRSGLFLMASFIGVAGLFILLSADLLGLLQVMMYIGGMLVMILFMLLFSTDPGGSMMSSMMELKGFEKLFSGGLAHTAEPMEGHGDGGHEGMSMSHEEMSMFTPAKRLAGWLGLAAGAALVALFALRPAWPEREAVPDPDSAARVGDLLMTRYMIAFEGAGLIILLGIFGAVYLARPGRFPDTRERKAQRAAVNAPPAPIVEEPMLPEVADLRALEHARAMEARQLEAERREGAEAVGRGPHAPGEEEEDGT